METFSARNRRSDTMVAGRRLCISIALIVVVISLVSLYYSTSSGTRIASDVVSSDGEISVDENSVDHQNQKGVDNNNPAEEVTVEGTGKEAEEVPGDADAGEAEGNEGKEKLPEAEAEAKDLNSTAGVLGEQEEVDVKNGVESEDEDKPQNGEDTEEASQGTGDKDLPATKKLDDENEDSPVAEPKARDDDENEETVSSKEAKSSGESEDDDKEESAADNLAGGENGVKKFPICSKSRTEIIPCLDMLIRKKMKLKLKTPLMEHYERHCPTPNLRLKCLVPPPKGYKIPIPWPASRDEVWQANVPHTFLAQEKSDQNWMVVEGEKVRFPGGGTHFSTGADKYIEQIAKMLGSPEGDISLGGRIRTVFDVGCGVASFGAFMLPNVLTVSLAPNDVHQNQIQFALERGIPAALGVLGTKRLPFPSKSFELAHCSRCRIDWAQRGGILLLEVDRLLRPGGYWVWSAPPVYRDDPEEQEIWESVASLAKRMCWKVASKEGQTVIFKKPLSNRCYLKREAGVKPRLCNSTRSPDDAWEQRLKACISPLPGRPGPQGKKLVPWPRRLKNPPPRLRDVGATFKQFALDTEIWATRVENYWGILKSADISPSSIRNVMDMSAGFGSFAAALIERPVWVMNVVPTTKPNTLPVVYDRGLIGMLQNWCESFSTYPRTYDLLHAFQLVSEVEPSGCQVSDLLLEMDRLLRPQGIVIIRDTPETIGLVRQHLVALRWIPLAGGVTSAPADQVSDGTEEILVAQKTFWDAEEAAADAGLLLEEKEEEETKKLLQQVQSRPSQRMRREMPGGDPLDPRKQKRRRSSLSDIDSKAEDEE